MNGVGVQEDVKNEFPDSSTVEQRTVNAKVVGAEPTRGAMGL